MPVVDLGGGGILLLSLLLEAASCHKRTAGDQEVMGLAGDDA
jgi:hypothetical protein